MIWHASSGHSVAPRDDVRLNSLAGFYNSESVSEVRFRFGVMAHRVGVHGLQVSVVYHLRVYRECLINASS